MIRPHPFDRFLWVGCALLFLLGLAGAVLGAAIPGCDRILFGSLFLMCAGAQGSLVLVQVRFQVVVVRERWWSRRFVLKARSERPVTYVISTAFHQGLTLLWLTCAAIALLVGFP
jgi:hypothetical protein